MTQNLTLKENFDCKLQLQIAKLQIKFSWTLEIYFEVIKLKAIIFRAAIISDLINEICPVLVLTH